jgi:hypothetical protein
MLPHECCFLTPEGTLNRIPRGWLANFTTKRDISMGRVWEHWAQNIIQQFPCNLYSLPKNKSYPPLPKEMTFLPGTCVSQFLMHPTRNDTNFMSIHWPRENHPDKSSHCPVFNTEPVCQSRIIVSSMFPTSYRLHSSMVPQPILEAGIN